MANPAPIVMRWHNDAGAGLFIDPSTGDEVADAAAADVRLAAAPAGSKYILLREKGPLLESIPNGNYGMSYRDWVIGALDSTDAMNTATAAWSDAFFGAITERVDFILLDFETSPSYFGYFKGVGTNGTHTISTITWDSGSGGIATVTTATDHGAVGDADVNDADFITINGSVSAGSGNYNGYQHVLTSPTSTTLTFAAPVDGGAYTGDSGTLYGGVNGRDQHMQDVFGDATAAANLPASFAAIDGSDFTTNPDPADADDIVTKWGYWVTRQRQRQLRYMIIDRAETQLGYRPRSSNYSDTWLKWIVEDTAGGLQFSRGISNVSSPPLYFGSITGSDLTGTDRQKMFQHFLNRMGRAESQLASGNGELIPWVGTSPTGATEALREVETQLMARMWLHLYELGVRRFLWFNPQPHVNAANSANTAVIQEVIDETIPNTKFNPRPPRRVSMSDTSYTTGNVTTTLEWFEGL